MAEREVDPGVYAPPVSWWGQTWRVVLVLLSSGLVWSQVVGRQRGHVWLLVLDLGLGVCCFVLMFFRRRWPLTVAIITNLCGVVSGSSSGPSMLAGVSLATRREVWKIVLVGAISVGAGEVFNSTQPSNRTNAWWVDIAFGVAITVAMLVTGMYIGSRRELLWTLRERARTAEAQQEMRMTSARAAERERIAREMHDVLAHRISMVSMHAGALAYRTDLPPEQVRETAELIQTKAHEALTDLRQVLGVLREDDPVLRDRPQPTLRDLPELVGEARAAGMRVDLDVGAQAATEPGRDLPDSVGRTVYRIVQEGLTNARKHALGAAVRVEVSGDRGPGIDVWVRNEVRATSRTTTPGAGLGLIGLKERTELAGGRLDVVSEGGSFALHGWLPWPT